MEIVGFAIVVLGIGALIGLLSAPHKKYHVAATLLSPCAAWIVLLTLGSIESAMSQNFAKGIGAVLLITPGYVLIFALPVAIACYAVQRWRSPTRTQ